MRKSVLLASGFALCLALPAVAQTTDSEPQAMPEEQQQQQQEPAATTEEMQGSTSQSGTQAGASGTDGEIMPEEEETQIRAEKLMGMQVVNPQGEELGTVSDIVFDESGMVNGIVLSTGGFLGIGAKPVGISWSDMASAMDADVLTIDVSKEQIAQAPEFKTKDEKREEQPQQQ